MIDLHMHTLYSDGTDTVPEILHKCQKAGLEVISITDHNTVNAYTGLETYSSDFPGKILMGCEFTTSYQGRLIEVLGYGFEYHQVENYLTATYTAERIAATRERLYSRLLKRINNLGLQLAEQDLPINFTGEFFEKPVYEALIKYEENTAKLHEAVFTSFSDFFRKGLTNPKSALFINHAAFYPALDEIIKMIHAGGGIAFLAHPYQYKYDDTENFITNLYQNTALDGIECHYTAFSAEQTRYLLHFAADRKLLVSGGSDYHGSNKKNHALGTGAGNLNIPAALLNTWPVSYYK